MPRQLTLDLRPEPHLTLENFIAGPNVELLARLRALAQPHTFEAVYLWGPPGSGRSHLLQATRAAAEAAGRRAVYVAAEEAGADLPCPAGGLLVVDDVDRLTPAAQLGLFRAFNSARLAGLALLLAGPQPPGGLLLREDLRTRIGQAIVYALKPLGDEEKAATLQQRAAQRGLPLDEGVVTYMLRHSSRELSALMALLDELDRAALERKRPVTVPLVRELLSPAERRRR